MKTSFELDAEFRDGQGKSASRRLRRAGQVPAILYGGKREPRALALDHQKLLTLLDNERFYSTILSIRVGEQSQAAILKDVQRHPAKNQILHLDLQRVLEDEKIRMMVPLHFTGEGVAPGVKTQGGVISHHLNQVQVYCLPKDLPEFLTVDVSEMQMNQIKRMSDIPLPEGVELADLSESYDEPVVSVHHARAAEVEPVAAEVAAAATAVVPGAPPPAPAAAAPAAAAEPKKETGKK